MRTFPTLSWCIVVQGFTKAERAKAASLAAFKATIIPMGESGQNVENVVGYGHTPETAVTRAAGGMLRRQGVRK